MTNYSIQKSDSIYGPELVGSLAEPTLALFSGDTTVAECISTLRELVKREFITYCYIINNEQHLEGVIVLRELLFAAQNATLREIMLANPFWLRADTTVLDAMREVLTKHFPVYPVCGDSGNFIGVVRGSKLFEQQAIELSAQPGSMVGVEKEERLDTSWLRSFKFRHPWLQLNLLTAFLAGGVVSAFDSTINRVVILAAFLPVLAGQSGNTGCQALAVTLRGLTLGDYRDGAAGKLLRKEALLGLGNGFFVGLVAGAGMYVMASMQKDSSALILSVVVLGAMTISCMVSGISGVLVPLTLKRFGFDPATASSIFLTTATDIASMGLLLSLATIFV